MERKFTSPAKSAGEAIEHALRIYRGCTVVECYSGNTEEDTVMNRQMSDKLAIAGLITHDIPPHVKRSPRAPLSFARSASTAPQLCLMRSLSHSSLAAPNRISSGHKKATERVSWFPLLRRSVVYARKLAFT